LIKIILYLNLNIYMNSNLFSANYYTCTGNYKKLKDLISDDKSVNLDEALYIACGEYPNLEIAKLLVENGADPNYINKYKSNALSKSSYLGKLEIVKMLLEHKITLDNINNALITASISNKLDIVKLLLNHNASPNILDENKRSPLMWASTHDNYEMVKLLFEKGGNINYINPIFNSILTNSIINYNFNIFKFLLDNKVDIYQKDYMGQNSFYVACQYQRRDMIQLFIDYGYKEDDEFKVILTATAKNWLETLKVLLKNSFQINIINNKGITPLMYACKNGNYEIVKLLLDNGANFTTKDISGFNATRMALIYENPEIYKLLKERGADE